MLEHVETIVDEVSGANGGAVVPFLWSLEAEPNAVLSHAGLSKRGPQRASRALGHQLDLLQCQVAGGAFMSLRLKHAHSSRIGGRDSSSESVKVPRAGASKPGSSVDIPSTAMK